MKSILIITYNMIPFSSGWGSCQRMFFLAEYLQNSGKETYVLFPEKQYSGDFGHQRNFSILPIKTFLFSLADPKMAPRGESKSNFFTILKQFLLFYFKIIERKIFNEPNPFMGTIGYIFGLKIKKNIYKYLDEFNIDVIIISGPPFSLFFLVGCIKRRFPNLKIIIDYRDPWNIYQPNFFSSYCEKIILQKADKIVLYNEQIYDDMIDICPVINKKSSFILNGYSEKDWSEVKKLSHTPQLSENDRLKISYIGSGGLGKSNFRDFTEFWEGFELFEKDKNIILRFIGVTPSNDSEKILKKYPNKIEIIPPVSHKESLQYMLESDVLLHIHTDSKTGKSVVAGKFYDYIKSGKIIFGISGDSQSYFFKILTHHKLGISCLNQKTEIQNCLNLLYQKWSEGKLTELRCDHDLNYEIYSREYQNSNYLKIIES